VARAAGRRQLIEGIAGPATRRYGMAMVLMHAAVAEQLGLGPADHKCLDLLDERGAMSGSQLAAATGLTSGAVTGVVARLERAGYLRREPDPRDGRKQVLRPVPDRVRDIGELFGPLRQQLAARLESFDARQLAAIAEFLAVSADCALQHAAGLRAQARSGGTPVASWEAGCERP
jgi:DNA-binding MarR family transcriptional regulator